MTLHTLSIKTQKHIAYEYCKAYSTPQNTHLEVTTMLREILSEH